MSMNGSRETWEGVRTTIMGEIRVDKYMRCGISSSLLSSHSARTRASSSFRKWRNQGGRHAPVLSRHRWALPGRRRVVIVVFMLELPSFRGIFPVTVGILVTPLLLDCKDWNVHRFPTSHESRLICNSTHLCPTKRHLNDEQTDERNRFLFHRHSSSQTRWNQSINSTE